MQSNEADPLAPRPAFGLTELSAGDYDRPLGKEEIVELLSSDFVEFELLLVNDVLKPSLTVEYHKGYFLGFFTYWDCLAARISMVLLGHVDYVEEAVELAEEIVPYVARAAMNVPYPLPIEETHFKGSVSYLLDVFIAPDVKQSIVGRQSELLNELAAAVVEMEEKFRIRIADERPVDLLPFAIDLNRTGFAGG